MKKSILALTILLLLAACTTKKEITPSESAKIDYEKAERLLNKGEYSRVNTFLDNFSALHPYSQYAVQAELLRAFAAYRSDEYILSETLTRQFIKRHPRHRDVAYAKYILAMSHYRQMVSEERDQSPTKLTIHAFENLIKQHPGTIYAKDAAPRLQSLYNRLSSHELTVGKFYFSKKRYVAAVNRFQVVLKEYQTTPAIEPSLYYLAAAYTKLGISDSAREIALLLRHNYPDSQWSHKVELLLQPSPEPS